MTLMSISVLDSSIFVVQLAKRESIVVDMSGHETNPFADPNADPFSVSFGELYVAGGV